MTDFHRSLDAALANVPKAPAPNGYSNGGIVANGSRYIIVAENAIRAHILSEVLEERRRQIAKWGPQTHPDIAVTLAGADHRRKVFARAAEEYKTLNDARESSGQPGIWCDIWLEEIYEALEEGDVVRLRKELIESMAVAAAWIEDIDQRHEVPSGS